MSSVTVTNPRTVAKRRWIKKVALERGCSYAVAAHIFACKPSKIKKRIIERNLIN